MISNRPYLLRAFNQWIVDSKCTPILVIDAKNPRCKIPLDYAEGGEIVFNISTSAVRDLKITNELVEFKASFSGVIHMIAAPIKAILAVYAEENGEGIFFDADESDDDSDSDSFETAVSSSGVSDIEMVGNIAASELNEIKGKPFLKLVE